MTDQELQKLGKMSKYHLMLSHENTIMHLHSQMKERRYTHVLEVNIPDYFHGDKFAIDMELLCIKSGLKVKGNTLTNKALNMGIIYNLPLILN